MDDKKTPQGGATGSPVPTPTTTEKKPQSDKEACLFILKNRIEDFRALENFLVHFGVNYDKSKWGKKIGGIQKVMDYIKSH